MADLIVNIELEKGTILENNGIPGEYVGKRLIAELVEKLQLPRMDDKGNEITYSMELANQGTVLGDDQSLRDAGVQNGDLLRLIKSQNVPIDKTLHQVWTAQSQSVTGTSGDFVVRLLDLNKDMRAALPLDVRISDLLAQLVKENRLPLKDKIEESVRYSLSSKALGRVLNQSRTLREEGVPNLDLIVVNRDEIAG